ncbi:hypothetical protein COB52_05285 [Candidatus Kaiserbacteria bacterium]|nr:MAG: hypothetical protein COB52_05285 [Candidatus Kaiserbacteria bacterium]
MDTILATIDTERGPEWEAALIAGLLKTRVKLIEEKATSGPDGFPYLLVETAKGDVAENMTDKLETEKLEPVLEIIDWLSQKGVGLVLNPLREPYPDLVLTYGMIWSLHRFGRIELPSENFSRDFQAGEPTEDVLPTAVRKMIKQFFLDNGVFSLKFMLVTRVEGLELCFSLESLGNPPSKEHEGVAEAISWFLPTNIGVSLASEKNIQGFVAV